MELKWKVHKWDWNPTTAQLESLVETAYSVMEIKRGMLIAWVAVRINTAFDGTTPKIEVGTSDYTDGFVTDSAVGGVGHGAVAELFNGCGNYLCPSMSQYYRPIWNQTHINALDHPQMILSYTGADDTTKGALSVIVVYAEVE